jgi:hypothetical protein
LVHLHHLIHTVYDRIDAPSSVMRGRATKARGADGDAFDLGVLDVRAVTGRFGLCAEGVVLVKGLEEMAVEARLIAHDLIEMVVAGEEAVHGPAVHVLPEVWRWGAGRGIGRRWVGGVHVAPDVEEAFGDDLSFEAEDAHDPPLEGGDAVGEGLLEAAGGRKFFEDGVAEGEPVVFVLEERDDGRDGEDAVLDGVEADDGVFGFDGRVGEIGLWVFHVPRIRYC